MSDMERNGYNHKDVLAMEKENAELKKELSLTQSELSAYEKHFKEDRAKINTLCDGLENAADHFESDFSEIGEYALGELIDKYKAIAAKHRTK